VNNLGIGFSQTRGYCQTRASEQVKIAGDLVVSRLE
jgi:hypothetical protein